MVPVAPLLPGLLLTPWWDLEFVAAEQVIISKYKRPCRKQNLEGKSGRVSCFERNIDLGLKNRASPRQCHKKGTRRLNTRTQLSCILISG